MRPDPKQLKKAILAEALRLGFQIGGVAPAEPPPHLGVYARWLEAGHHGDMGYLATEPAVERRSNPRKILPECKSVLVLGIRHPAPNGAEPSNGKTPTGRIAAYAWGQDYHDELARRLRSLAAFIEDQAGRPVPNRWYTDTGPILEREFAQRAGLGWIGKNTCLIHPGLGSYFLLAEMLLGIELPPDPPQTADFCGSCTRCIDACPTGCILDDRTLDATRCISYLTIEVKGSIPTAQRPQMENWIFGCDVCQEVCPWNIRFAAEEGDPAFRARENVPLVDLQQEIHITPEAFNRKFKGSPVKRPKRRGYLRNVAVALGNLGGPGAVADLAQVLAREPEPLVRAHAAWAMGQIGGPAALQALETAAASETDPEVTSEILAAIQEIPSAGRAQNP